MRKLFAALLAAAALTIAVAMACAPMFPKAVFTYARHPDFPRTEYLSGRLGVFLPSYARSYLVIAYRYLHGPGLSAEERQQVKEYWKDRQTGHWDNTATIWLEEWKKLRTRVPGARRLNQDPMSQERCGFDRETNSFYLNCAEDAFRTAWQTLRARADRFGWRSAAVRSWRDAQDEVFSNCSAEGGGTPSKAVDSLPALIRADREYQIAAAHFYAGNQVEAETIFRRIAETPSSPWSRTAPYLVVRTLYRAVSPQSEVEARKILADKRLSHLHGMTRVLLDRMILKEGDENYFHDLARDLASGRTGRSMREELWDYTTGSPAISVQVCPLEMPQNMK